MDWIVAFSHSNVFERWVSIALTEGRNRQIRKMIKSLGLTVVSLHRTSFAGINLKGLAEGNWLELSEKEMTVIQDAISAAAHSPTTVPIEYDE